MWFKVLYFIYLILAYLFPTVNVVGSLSIRHIMMLVMLVACIVKGIRWDGNMTLYTVFWAFFGLSSVLTGFAGVFFSKFFGTFMQAYVIFFATYVLIKKYDGANWLYYFFLVFGLLDAIVTIGQFYHMGFAERIVELIGTNYDEDFISRMERYDIMEGVAVQGLVDSVRNGYFLSAMAVLALYNRKGRITLFNLIVWFVIMAASLLAQERMGFFVAVLLSFLIFISTVSVRFGRIGWLVVVLFAFVALVFLPMGWEALQGGDLRFSKEIDIAGERGALARIGWDYFINHPLGAYYEYDFLGYPYPHNVFVNMFLTGGIFGGIAVLIMFFKQIVAIVKYLFRSMRTRKITIASMWGLMFIAYSLNSITHNASIVFGTYDFFIFWGAFEAIKKKENLSVINRLAC